MKLTKKPNTWKLRENQSRNKGDTWHGPPRILVEIKIGIGLILKNFLL